jgi:predicted glycosyltransferase
MHHLVEALIHKMDPLGQYKNIKIITGPELLQSKKQKKAQKKACQSALTYSSNLVPPKEYGIEQAKTVYFSRKDGELPI